MKVVLICALYRIASFSPAGFGYETTNSIAYKDFKFSSPEKGKDLTPKVEAVTTSAPKEHFQTTAKKVHKAMHYQKPEIDRIPYP
jgi:hypothetical protein